MDDSRNSSDDFDAVVLCAIEATRDVIAYWLSNLALRVLVTVEGQEADRAARKPLCRVLVTDRVLPPWPGMTEFHRLLSINPDLRILFVEDGNLHSTGIARICGVTDLLPRPLSRRNLLDAIERVPSAPKQS